MSGSAPTGTAAAASIGMDDVSLLPRITARLRREGLREADIAKIMGGNLLRVLRQVQAGAAAR